MTTTPCGLPRPAPVAPEAAWVSALASTLVAALLGTTLAPHAAAATAATVDTYQGLCDASAAVMLDDAHFIVADDEHDTLQVYRRGTSAPVARLALKDWLGSQKESDLEGAARIGDVVYWIASHGRNSQGKVRDERHQFFATEVVPGRDSAPPTLRPLGRGYRNLLDDLVDASSLKRYDLKAAARRAAEAPGGLNIEGLAATADGRLLLGLRNPVPAGNALVIPIENPREVALQHAQARIGTPLELPLGGRGIRSLERVGAGYLIVAGPSADAGSFALYRWSGRAGDAPQALPVPLGSLRPEALFTLPEAGRVMLLSDDGGVETAGIACKDRPAGQRAFRSLTVEVPVAR